MTGVGGDDRSLAEDRLRRLLPQVARAAAQRGGTNGGERGAIRDEGRRRLICRVVSGTRCHRRDGGAKGVPTTGGTSQTATIPS